MMFNSMNCSHIIYGPGGLYSISYMASDHNFLIYTRQYEHDFKVPIITKENLEGAICLEMRSINCFIVAKDDSIRFFSSEDTFSHK